MRSAVEWSKREDREEKVNSAVASGGVKSDLLVNMAKLFNEDRDQVE